LFIIFIQNLHDFGGDFPYFPILFTEGATCSDCYSGISSTNNLSKDTESYKGWYFGNLEDIC